MGIYDPQPFAYGYDHLYRPPTIYPNRYPAIPRPYPGTCPGCGQCQTCGKPVPGPYVAPWRRPTVTWTNKSDNKLP